MNCEYAKVRLLDAPPQLDREYDYRIPAELSQTVAPGSFVTVPFGGQNYRRRGIVTALCDTADYPNVKPIAGRMPQISLDEEMLGLLCFLRENTLCATGDAVHCMIPPKALTGLCKCYRAVEGAEPKAERRSETELFLFEFLRKNGETSYSSLRDRFGEETDTALEKLRRAGLITQTQTDKEGQKEKISITYRRTEKPVEGRLGEKQKELLTLLETEEQTGEELRARGFTGQQCAALIKKGLVLAEENKIERGLPQIAESFAGLPADFQLNEEQNTVFEGLCKLANDKAPHCALLHGVTGSGKTPVMLKLIDEMLKQGKGVILLLPEISLTPQTLSIFCSRYGEKVAVWHSGLSDGERFDTYHRVQSGQASVVVGTRSAVFAPVKNLGLIAIDEEHEHTYKSDSNPKYHARDVARFRAAYHKALLLLCSATPSLESYKRAVEGRYTLFQLKHRHAGAELPEVVVADMRKEKGEGALSPLGTELTERLKNTVGKGEQAVLFLNRRGYNHVVTCRSCGEALTCPSCSVTLTYHTTKKSYEEGYLVCHFCGRRMKLPEKCPSCGSGHLARIGFGTQRIEQELESVLPGKKVLRMDTDSTLTKGAYDELLSTFRRHEADVLLGTQMVTKGHDFPDVTLVGVLMADSSLYLDDYRAGERTFSMLTQVIGRAGRSKKKGVAVIQTNNPDNEVIKLACAQDYEGFYKREIMLRRTLVFPPFCDIVLLTLSHGLEQRLLPAATKLTELMKEVREKEFPQLQFLSFGPFEAPIYRADGRYRVRLVLKCAFNKETRLYLSRVLSLYGTGDDKQPLLSLDVNPSNL